MTQRDVPRDAILAIVLVHLGVTLAHAFAHAGAGVELSRASMLFVYTVILIGPIAGLLVQRLVSPRGGSWLVAATLAGALAFGAVNHFVIQTADHVSQVAGPWRALFGITAVLLVALEALGSALAVWCATEVRTPS